MTPFEFLKITLASWYISHAVTSTNGPMGVFHWMRETLAHGRVVYEYPIIETDGKGNITAEHKPGDIKFSGLLDCILCLAVWVALVLILVRRRAWIVIDPAAAAGGALLLHSFTGWRFGE